MDDGTKVQQSMTVNPVHYGTERMLAPKRGVILDIKYPDDPANRSAMEHQDLRGYLATATVLVTEPYAIIPNVLIPPGDSAHGIDNFEEWYPRGSANLVTGQEFDRSLSQIDPYDLDGDWCIIQFINGQIDSPYVARWWPNPRAIQDTLTTGKAYPPQNGAEGTALNQKGRYFRRTNGVEYVVTPEGDLWLSTYRAGSTIVPGGEELDGGRFPRAASKTGGNIKVQVKPSKILEMSWDEQIDGIGADDLPDESLPQANPANPAPAAAARSQTYVRIDKEMFELEVPVTLEVRSSDRMTLSATNNVDIETETVNLKANTGVNIGSDSAEHPLTFGDILAEFLSAVTFSTSVGPTAPGFLPTATSAGTITTANIADLMNSAKNKTD